MKLSGWGRYPVLDCRVERLREGGALPALLRGAGVALSFLPWLALLGWLSAAAWFLCDDAFISFRYARNLLDGHGLVFNPGEYVEGYTNLLWLLELAALWGLLGVPPEQAAPWLSVACTVGTVAALGVWLARLPQLRHRWLVAWMAFGLLCSSATFAVWTSGGGLETRAVHPVHRGGGGVPEPVAFRASRAGSGVAEPGAGGLYPARGVVGRGPVHRLVRPADDGGRRAHPAGLEEAGVAGGTVRGAGGRALPVPPRLLWRVAAPTRITPSTCGPGTGLGFRYLWAAALETGLYLLLPLAAIAARNRWRAHRDGAFALPLVLVGVHMAYVMRIGGDLFEYRPLDFYWPLLALPAAVGIARLGSRLAAGRWHRRLPGLGARACAVAVFVPVLFYAGAIQGARLFEGAALRGLVRVGFSTGACRTRRRQCRVAADRTGNADARRHVQRPATPDCPPDGRCTLWKTPRVRRIPNSSVQALREDGTGTYSR